MLITSVNNNHIKELTKLNQKKERDTQDLFLVEGHHLVTEAYNTDLLKEIIALEDVSLPFDYPITYVTKEVMAKLSKLDSPPQVMAVVKKPHHDQVGNHLLILDSIQDPGNLGTIIRSAVAFNFDTIILNDKCVDVYNPKVIRSTQGMLFHINILTKDLGCFINNLKEAGYQIYGTDVTNGQNIKKLPFPQTFAIIIGNEGQGISPDIKKLCNQNICLPMNPNVESLNAAVAASIIMYEVNNP